MPLLEDVRSMFRRRRRSIAMDLTDTQAGGLAGANDQLEPTADGDDAGANIHLVEPKPVRARGGQDEIMGLVRRIGEHLDSQSERTERLLNVVDRLPQALDALPEINRQNARLLESLHDHFAQTQRREEMLGSAMSTISETSGRQTEVLGLVQQQLDSNRETASTLGTTLETLQHAIGNLAESNGRSAQVLARMSETAAERENELSTTIARTQRWMICAVFVCGAASVIAVAVAVFSLLR